MEHRGTQGNTGFEPKHQTTCNLLGLYTLFLFKAQSYFHNFTLFLSKSKCSKNIHSERPSCISQQIKSKSIHWPVECHLVIIKISFRQFKVV